MNLTNDSYTISIGNENWTERYPGKSEGRIKKDEVNKSRKLRFRL